MAAYGALITLTNIMKPIRQYQARYPVFSDQQLRQLESLEQKVLFLQKLLETYSTGRRSYECEALEGQIADVVYYAQDFIESRIADVIGSCFPLVVTHVESDQDAESEDRIESHIRREIFALCVTTWKTDSDVLFSEGLQKVIQVLGLIQYDASNIAENANSLQKDKHPGDSTSVGLDKSQTTDQFKKLDPCVTFGNALDQIVDMLLTRRQLELQTIPITGMGGIGKTTLAKTVYHNPRIAQHFDVRGWVTISQEFSPGGILFGLLSGMNVTNTQGEYHELGDKLHKHLYGRRYLVILDDVWSVEAWDKVKRFLPDNNKGSRIIVTTRLSTLGDSISSKIFKMSLLNENESWSLLKRKVFSTESSCTPELEEIGNEIAKSCKGLPLSIDVMAGLLAKCVDREYWKSVQEDVNSGVNSEVSDHCLKIIETSYHHLPIHLKPCFIYFGVYPEDHEVKVNELIDLWVAEGFLKPREGKRLEEVAYEYLQDLANRNLIVVSEWTFRRNVEFCKIHDLLRDLCLREDKKKRFRSPSYCSQYRIHSSVPHEKYSPECDYALPSSSLIRLLDFDYSSTIRFPSSILKLLRTCKSSFGTFPLPIMDVISMRYIDVSYMRRSLLSMDYLLWNLHTLIIAIGVVDLPYEIWEMPQLRNVVSRGGSGEFTILDHCGAKRGGVQNIVLENLHTLGLVKNFRCSEEILGKIPNLKKLKVRYNEEGKEVSSEHIKNLGRLRKLESLWYHCRDSHLAFETKLEFSTSITKLVFSVGYFDWEDMGKHVGSLPHLQKLKLSYENGGEEWNLGEGEFPSLRYLIIRWSNLVRWTTDGGSVLPCLEHLVLDDIRRMEGIPIEIGDISTLQTIHLYGSCNDDVIESGINILRDQRQLGNQDLALSFNGVNFEG